MGNDTLSPESIERICRLNASLAEAATWIENRSRLTLDAYLAGGGVESWRERGNIWEDYELDAVVKCSLGRDDPAFNPDDEYAGMLAVMDTHMLKWQEKDILRWSDCTDDWWSEGLPRIEAFRQTRFCYLFHELYEHTLQYDLDTLLRIGEIEINLVLQRQRGIQLDRALLPRKGKKSYPRSIFSRFTYPSRRAPLMPKELRYARLLNQSLGEARAWIMEQARRSEKEYADIGGLEACLAEDNAYEDYAMMMEVCGCLGENHPEYMKDDDNYVVRYSEPIDNKSRRIFGRCRDPFPHNRYHAYFAPHSSQPLHRRDDTFDKIRPCGLFWNIFEEIDRDWLKMLSIGELWLNVDFVQRRIALV